MPSPTAARSFSPPQPAAASTTRQTALASHLVHQQPSTSTGSATTTITTTPTSTNGGTFVDRVRVPPSRTLRLRGAEGGPSRLSGERGRRIQWAEDVVDNEGMGKKSSKVCCIYHKPRAVGDSSDESSSDSSDSDSDAESDNDDGAARPGKGYKRNCDGHGHSNGHGHDHGDGDKGKGRAGHSNKRPKNAYERMPKVDTRST